MAKKKAKKKNIKKKDARKKDVLKKKELKKKLKKKEQKRKEQKKKERKKKASGKKQLPGVKQLKEETQHEPASREKTLTDHSSNYNVRNAVARLRSLRSPEELDVFTKGEKRLTVTRAIPAVLKRMNN